MTENNVHFRDQIVVHLIWLILYQLPGLIPMPEEFSLEDRACVCNLHSSYRIFTFRTDLRDDYPIPFTQFCELLSEYSKHPAGEARPLLYNIQFQELPGYFHAVYWSVSIPL